MVRSPCCEKMGLRKGPWTAEEDQILVSYIKRHGHGNWRALPKQAGLPRCGKSCRLRWINYLRPDIKRGNFTAEEEEAIVTLHATLGNRWSAIAAKLPGRTDNEIKNVWHTYLKKRAHPTTNAALKDTKRGLISRGGGDDDKAVPPAALQSHHDASAGFTTSLQSSTSESSTPSATREHNNEGCSSGRGFHELLPDLDGRLWSEACLPMEKHVTSMEPFGSGAVPSSETPGSFLLQMGSCGDGEDDMDFWLNILMGSGDLP